MVLQLRPISVPERPAKRPWAYFMTFSCYGTRLHGRQAGSVDRHHNAWKGRYLEPSRGLKDHERRALRNPRARLDRQQRHAVLQAIREVCRHEGWTLHAAHVRTNHVHVVVSAESRPETALAKLKAYASRSLNHLTGAKLERWTRHGSTRWLWEPKQVDQAAHYVVKQQRHPMETYENPTRWADYLHTPTTEPRPSGCGRAGSRLRL